MENNTKFKRVVILDSIKGCTGVYPEAKGSKTVFVFIEVKSEYISIVEPLLVGNWQKSLDPKKGAHFAIKCVVSDGLKDAKRFKEVDKLVKIANKALGCCEVATSANKNWMSELRKLLASMLSQSKPKFAIKKRVKL